MEEEITFLAVKLAVRRDDLFAAASDQQHSLKIHRQSFDEHHIRSFPEKILKQSAFKKRRKPFEVIARRRGQIDNDERSAVGIVENDVVERTRIVHLCVRFGVV